MASSPLQDTAKITAQGAKVMIYGPAGVGKTRLLGTAPAPVIISAEKGLLSLKDQSIPYYEIKSFKDFQQSWLWASTSAEARKFSTICLDSVSEISHVLLLETKARIKDGRAAYGDMQDAIGALVRNFRDLNGPNVALIFQQEFYKDEALGTAVFMPTVPGNTLKQTLPYLCDEVFYMHRIQAPDGSNYAALRTQPDFRTVAKDRSGMLDVIERPDLTYVFNKMMGRL